MPNPQPNPVDIALEIKRGTFKLQHVPEDQRALVAAVLYKLTDADAGVILASRERRTKQFGRFHVKTRNALQ